MVRKGFTLIELIVVVVVILGFILVIAGGFLGGFGMVSYFDDRPVDISVTKTYVVPTELGNSYRIVTKEHDTLEIVDDWWKGVHDSATLFGGLDAEKRYRVQIYHSRSPFWSRFAKISAIIAELPDDDEGLQSRRER